LLDREEKEWPSIDFFYNNLFLFSTIQNPFRKECRGMSLDGENDHRIKKEKDELRNEQR